MLLEDQLRCVGPAYAVSGSSNQELVNLHQSRVFARAPTVPTGRTQSELMTHRCHHFVPESSQVSTCERSFRQVSTVRISKTAVIPMLQGFEGKCTVRTANVPPHAPTLMEATRAIGYSLEAAIADIIDNSIAARATQVEVQFFPIGDSYVAVLDNGTGMDEPQLLDAMRYGSKSPTAQRELTDLGRFGLGLKTASLSQCRKLTVISWKNGSVVGAQWDLDLIIATGEWSLRVLDPEDVQTFPAVQQLLASKSGTLVIWQELDRLKAGEVNFEAALGQKMDRVREHLSLVFHRYLAGEKGIRKLEIKMNGTRVEPIDPFIASKSTQLMDDEEIRVEGKKVTVRPYILPHPSKLSAAEIRHLGGQDGLRRLQGFYVYRNKRLLVWGTWFRLIRQGELSKLARVRVDIPNSLDHLWTLDIKKSTAVPPEVVRRNLSTVVERITESSRRTWVYRGKKEIDDTHVHVWNRLKTRDGGVQYLVNRDYPLVQTVLTANGSSRQALEHLLTQIERQLPLNQLQVDFTNDVRVGSEGELTLPELRALYQQLIAACRTEEERKGLRGLLMVMEPFDQHPEFTAKLVREGEPLAE